MGSFKWGYKSLVLLMTIVTLLITPLITTHGPPSRDLNNYLYYFGGFLFTTIV